MKRRAFTLMEVILCLAMVAALAGGVMGFLFNLLSRREAIAEVAARQQGAGALIEHIESDLASGLVGDQRSGGGIVGSSSSLVLLTRGVWMPQSARPEGVMGDLQGGEYAFDRSAGVVRARRWAGGDEDPSDPEVICSGVELARFRYFDGESWSDSFDSMRRGQLPVAVELAIWFGTARPEEAVLGIPREAPTTGGPPAPSRPAAEANAPVDPGTRAAALPTRNPDRVRLMIVPDGPVTAWLEGAP